MTLTPEQKTEGWIEWNGGRECPIKSDSTIHQVMRPDGSVSDPMDCASGWHWRTKIAYRIIEAHGADAEPARPTPFPASMDDLVYDSDGMSQPFITNGEWPEWLPDEALWQGGKRGPIWHGKLAFDTELAIRVRRREPKRETVTCLLISSPDQPPRFASTIATIDLLDGKPDLSTLKIEEGSA